MSALNITCILTANVIELMSEPSGFRIVRRDKVKEHNLVKRMVTNNKTNV